MVNEREPQTLAPKYVPYLFIYLFFAMCSRTTRQRVIDVDACVEIRDTPTPTPAPAPAPAVDDGPAHTVSSHAGGGRNSVVRRFLASLQPPLDELTPILVQGGVRDRACLDSLMAMNGTQQRSMLERLPLTSFQVQLILNALEERRTVS